MNVNNLEQLVKQELYVKQIINNYKELCRLCGLPIKAGKSKQLQLKELARYFRWHKDGNKFVIDEIYSNPLPKVDNRSKSKSARNNVYGKYIDPILLKYFTDIDIKTIHLTTNTIAELVGLINKNYSHASSKNEKFYNYCKKDIKHKFSNLEFNICSVWDIFGTVKGRLKDTIRYSLKRLQEKGYIKFKETYLLSYKFTIRSTTDTEDMIIEKIDKKVCEKLYIEKKNKLQYNDRLRNKYYIAIDKQVREQIGDVDMVYRGYEINICKDKIIENQTIEQDMERLKIELNQIFINRIIDKITDIHKQNLLKPKIWGTINSCTNIKTKATYLRQQESYLQYSKYICNLLLNVNNKVKIQ
ncbi:hypothetical protein [Clostridium tyrobutyricum]|uniref:hypothetical protein n=1 Tax=Clostridium tyrobutyricum TaxID=1519 RepID=UPI002B210550|nr:hypothetical protein [Clostridium tyrobutyricum]MEA5008760.1 hypothetical protein [Clostridium tyrobutyricum]